MYKVLLVDDEPAICKGLQVLIEWNVYGFEVGGYALSGEEALSMAAGSQFDLVITDIRMPGMDGIELIRCMKERKYPTRVIILSGYKDFEYAQAALEYGVRRYVLKPVSESTLVQALEGIRMEIVETALSVPLDHPPLPAPAGVSQNVPSNPTIDAIVRYIKDHCFEEISLKSISRRFYLNPAYLGRLFKNTKGIHFNDFVVDCRIDRAARLLLDEGLMVYEVSEKAGYKDINYFSRLFKSRKGVTPSEYRTAAKSGKLPASEK